MTNERIDELLNVLQRNYSSRETHALMPARVGHELIEALSELKTAKRLLDKAVSTLNARTENSTFSWRGKDDK